MCHILEVGGVPYLGVGDMPYFRGGVPYFRGGGCAIF